MAEAGAHKILTSIEAVKSKILRKRFSNLDKCWGRTKVPMPQLLAWTWPLKETRRRWKSWTRRTRINPANRLVTLCLKENFSLKTLVLIESPLPQAEHSKETTLCMSSIMVSQRWLLSTRGKRRAIRISIEEVSTKDMILTPSSWMTKNQLGRPLLIMFTQEASHQDTQSLSIDGSRVSTSIPGSTDPTFRAKISQNFLKLWVWAWILKWLASSGP